MLLKRHITCILLAVLLISAANSATSRAEGFEVLRGASLIDAVANDGDSFHVMAGGRHLLVRLYFVDCPETSALAASDARRLSEQMRYFGLPSVVDAVAFGKAAKAFTAGVLATPFTLYTSFAAAPGRSSIPRIYGFIDTSGGEDLASLLVREGLARPYGVRRETPRGIAHDEMAQRLRDMEASAMLKRSGIWARSDPERIAQLRADQRSEDRRLSAIQEQVRAQEAAQPPIDINTASQEQLTSVSGIGPALAARIIAGRPYASVDELAKITGIGAAKIAAWKAQLYVK